MIFDGPWDDDERYILDDRQLYFLKQAGERLSSQDFQDLKQENDDELGFYSCTVDGELDRKKLPSSFWKSKCGLAESYVLKLNKWWMTPINCLSLVLGIIGA